MARHQPDAILAGIAEAIRERYHRAGVSVQFKSAGQALHVRFPISRTNNYMYIPKAKIVAYRIPRDGTYGFYVAMTLPCRQLDVADPAMIDQLLDLIDRLRYEAQ
jgi:hypothetical protein